MKRRLDKQDGVCLNKATPFSENPPHFYQDSASKKAIPYVVGNLRRFLVLVNA
jgi:hypothetical protein